MKIKYMGTAAAEGIPAIFCQCDLCTKARENKGKDIRGRSGMIIDEHFLLDFPPDMYMHSLNYNIDLVKIKDILITHTHSDHFAAAELMMRMPECYCHIKDGERFVNLYGNKAVGDILKMFLKLEFDKEDDVDFIKYKELKKFENYKISDYNIIPLPAAHMPSEDAFMYIIQKDNKNILYAHDTGFFKQETFAFLNEKQIKFDFISFDCTGGINKSGDTHMGMPDVLRVKERLEQQNNLKSDTKYVLSHFSHNCRSLHNEIKAKADNYNFIVAYDGMEFEI